ncbi:hypothetical protein ANCCEY_00270 [Ancylostoma ceylanicum]|uniref:Transporter, major facilitator family protein n=1 Tax=Ancylostoma ceylanicum TaxID=53326 RepID=A0A0D6MDI1_9BILA|nr:hypothetical protein ANCCEY_00270 [Ancylostoma ceylanicum]
MSFVAESVLHSVNGREPTRIDAYAGYYGQATCFASFMIACIFAPSILSVLSPKWTLFLGSVCYTVYQMGFFYLNSYYYYTSCALMGVGFALFYSGHGAYLTSHSTRKTIEQNSAIAWSIGCLCMIVGGAILAGIFSLNHSAPELSPLLNTTSAHAGHAYRQFSDMEIRMMYGAFTAVTLCANLIFALAPSREIPDCIEGKHNKLRRTFKEELVGIIISTLSKRIKDFGLKPTMFCGFGLTSVILAVMVAAVPKSATVGLTDEPAWLVQPSVVLSVFTAFLIGLADSCVNNVRTVICALALPDHRAQAFAISKFYQAFAGTILMFLSPYLSIYHYSALLFFTLCLSTSCFVHVAGRTKRMERESIRQYLDAKDVLPEKY